jgi:periplasmic copper chaperone A
MQRVGMAATLRILAVSAVLAALSAGAASAHVVVAPNRVPAGDYPKLFFRVYHGCGHHATTRLTVQVPEGFVNVRPQPKPGWEISTKSAPYREPVTMEGMKVTEGFNEVTWSGGPIPPMYMDEFALSALAPKRPGTYRFVAVQECAGVPEPVKWTPELVVEAGDGGGGSVLQYIPLIVSGLGLLVAVAALVLAVNRQA